MIYPKGRNNNLSELKSQIWETPLFKGNEIKISFSPCKNLKARDSKLDPLPESQEQHQWGVIEEWSGIKKKNKLELFKRRNKLKIESWLRRANQSNKQPNTAIIVHEVKSSTTNNISQGKDDFWYINMLELFSIFIYIMDYLRRI